MTTLLDGPFTAEEHNHFAGKLSQIIYQTYFLIPQGDPNVPARQLSIEAHLDQPMILSKTQQETLGNIENLVKEEVIVTDPKLLAQPQPFAVPYGVHDRGMREVSSQLGLPLNCCRRR